MTFLYFYMCPQSPQTPSSAQSLEDPLIGEAAGAEEGAQAFLSEISEEDVEELRQREEALLQIEVRGFPNKYEGLK